MAKRKTGKKAAAHSRNLPKNDPQHPDETEGKANMPPVKAGKRKKKKKRPAGGPPGSPALPIPAVRVRMFRHGLGDCFLLTFDAGGDERHMLIDCGTLGKKNTTVTVDDIGRHLQETIGEQGRLHVVVGTHEHQDHLSGFNNQAIKQLQGRVDHVWLAWTENPEDLDAQRLAKHKQDLGAALAAVARAAPLAEVGMQVRDLLGFAGDMTLGAAFAKTVHEAMEFVRTGLGAKARYFNPGDKVEEAWLPGFRIYILGPSRSDQHLKDLGEHGSDELFGLLRAAESRTASPDKPLSPEERARCELELPFDLRFVQRGDELKQNQYPDYCAPSENWRSIDDDWLSLASNLALQLDSLTNNTSLVLAIERIADGKVLLFPADAQQGNWLSWHDSSIRWTVSDPSGGTRLVTAADLLARTVFYKVGHHSSHNATARGKGLELMAQEDELTAFIPVDRAVALTRNPQGSWQMPARPLYRRLLEKCQGRVARSDLGWAAKPGVEPSTESDFKGMATDEEWTRWAKSQQAAAHVSIGDLFVEYVLR